MLNSVQKNKEKIERKLSVTRDRNVDRALMKSTRNDGMFKILKDLVVWNTYELSNMLWESFGRNHSRRTGYCAKSPGACPGPDLQ